jgi:hypothetical protein
MAAKILVHGMAHCFGQSHCWFRTIGINSTAYVAKTRACCGPTEWPPESCMMRWRPYNSIILRVCSCIVIG